MKDFLNENRAEIRGAIIGVLIGAGVGTAIVFLVEMTLPLVAMVVIPLGLAAVCALFGWHVGPATDTGFGAH